MGQVEDLTQQTVAVITAVYDRGPAQESTAGAAEKPGNEQAGECTSATKETTAAAATRPTATAVMPRVDHREEGDPLQSTRWHRRSSMDRAGRLAAVQRVCTSRPTLRSTA